MPRLSALLTMACLLAACPAEGPSSTTARRDPAAPPSAGPALSTDPPATVPPATVPPTTGPALEALPPALAAAGVRPVVRSLWRALEAIDAGDAAAMAPAMTDDGRWFPPGRPEESVGGPAELQRAMDPWTGDEIELDVRRIIDPGDGAFVAQVTVANREGAGLRNELVLLVEPRGDLVAAVHHFGDPLGPVRLGAGGKEEPLALGPVGEPTLEGGPAVATAVDAAKQLAVAVDARADEAARAYLREDVVLHDVIARRTRQGREGWLAGMRETLGPIGRLVVDQHLAGPRFIVLEGAIYGRDGDARDGDAKAEPQEHGFVDVHRIVDGAIAETWHYVNRRSRPYRPRLRP